MSTLIQITPEQEQEIIRKHYRDRSRKPENQERFYKWRNNKYQTDHEAYRARVLESSRRYAGASKKARYQTDEQYREHVKAQRRACYHRRKLREQANSEAPQIIQ